MTRENAENVEVNATRTRVWENLALVSLFGTILGQILVGGLYLAAQSVWLVCNLVMLSRDFVLSRPFSEKIKDAGLVAVTLALIILRLLGIY